jgi:hypothetical protein
VLHQEHREQSEHRLTRIAVSVVALCIALRTLSLS